MKTQNQSNNKSAISLRSIILGLLLIIPANYFAIRSTLPATSSLIYMSVFIIFFLALFNIIIRKALPRLALKQGEMATIYVMLCAAIVLVGHDFIQMMAPSFTYGFWYATPENEWQDLFWKDIPEWLVNSDKHIITGIYEGNSSFYDWRMFSAWIGPILWWSAFLFAVIYIMLCLNVFVRKQWIEREKLVYPIIRLPLEICRDGSSTRFFKNKLLWLGFGVAGFIDLINGLNVLNGMIPAIPTQDMEIGRYFTEKPLNAISFTPIMFFPYVTGIGFFMPLDLSFSYWFLYLFWKVQAIIGVSLGFPVESNLSISKVIHTQSQVSGAYITIGFIGLWMAREHLKSVFRRIFSPRSGVDDSNEPMSYRSAMVGIALCLAFIFMFCIRTGMTFWVIALFVALYYIIGISLTYIRAQLGPPVHQMFGQGPDSLIPQVLGTRRLSKGDMVMFAFFWGFNRSQRGNSMPHQLEAFKMSEQLNLDNKRMARVIIIATAFGMLVAFWAFFDLRYRYGLEGRTYEWGSRWAFDRLQSWFTNPVSAQNTETLWMAMGSSFVVLLSVLRTRFVWWPIHPVAYPLSSPGWGSNYTWSSIFISWLAKFAILKYGGHRAHTKAAYFFAGLILGDCIVGGAWDIIGVIFNTRTYVFGLG